MKFGRNLPRNQVSEWSSSYINYKGLKKLIKTTAGTVRDGADADLAGFFYSLDRSLEDVDAFYNKKFAGSSRRLKHLQDHYGKMPGTLRDIDQDDVEELIGVLLELRGQLRKLQWYGEVNRRGFVKITKKLDKKLPSACAQRRYLESRVDPKPFATNTELLTLLTVINDWLSRLGDAKVADDDRSTLSSQSIKGVSSPAALEIQDHILDALDDAICTDKVATLSNILASTKSKADDRKIASLHRLLHSLLQRSISCRARACIDMLLGQLDSLDEKDEISGRNCLHRLVLTVCRSAALDEGGFDARMSSVSGATVEPVVNNYITPAIAPILTPPSCQSKEYDNVNVVHKVDEMIQLLQHILSKLRPQQRTALQARDTYGRLPLHYAAQYGFVALCQIIIHHMQLWDQYPTVDGIDGPYWQDAEGWAPVHLSVIAGHPITTRILLDSENRKPELDDGGSLRRTVSRSSAMLSLAAKANYVVIVKLLVEAGVDINHQDEQGETALHLAARFGHDECAKILLNGTEYQEADTELVENAFSWSPLFIACVDGNLGVVELLIEAGAQLDKTDLSGWTAKEHAVLRGHMAIARIMTAVTARETSASGISTILSTTPLLSSSLEERSSHILSNGNASVRVSDPVKRFGHRYLTGESLVLVSLGTMDTRKDVEAVKLDRIPLAHAHSTQLDTALSVVISATGAKGESSVFDLPIQDRICTEPVAFTTPDASKVKLLFDIVPTYAGSKDRVVGRGVALLSSVRTMLGSKRSTLQGDISVPIMSANTLDVIGLVNFNFLVITPFTHPNMSITEEQTYWKLLTSTMLIGHRGLGKNLPGMKSLQLGENTIQSFIAAANLGASYVEASSSVPLSTITLLTKYVQLTKDHVPVIYHDFLVSETGIDAPVHTLTLEQFLHVSNEQTPRPSRASSPSRLGNSINSAESGLLQRKPRSLSASNSNMDRATEMREKMKHTRAFKTKGYKANIRGNCVQAPFTTLEEMFRKLPESIGFNIEMKYPMLFESEVHGMDTYAVELNSFVDSVLTKVYDLGKGRNIIFSSFNPDVCLLLSFKQPSIPILFLTDGSTEAAGDIRATSLQEAIRFASRWNLLGVVTAAEPLIMCPRLVRVVKESGLVCVSYGTMNNVPENVQLQVREGIDAVIVDSVLAIRKGLTASTGQPAEVTQENGSNPRLV